MNFIEKNKATITILGFFIVLIILIVIPTVIISNREDNKESFPNYKNVEISENDIQDPSSKSYIEIKNQLENDPYFIKEININNYNYRSYTSNDLKNMMWNFIFSYELSNRKRLASLNSYDSTFCMKSKNVINAFEELYGVNITKDLDILPTFYQYVTHSNDKYCFNFDTVVHDYDNTISLAIDGLSIKDKIVTANVYYYEYFTMETESELAYISTLKSHINNSNYSSASDVVTNNLNGKVTHKQVQFRIHNNGKYFKYQILSSKILDY